MSTRKTALAATALVAAVAAQTPEARASEFAGGGHTGPLSVGLDIGLTSHSESAGPGSATLTGISPILRAGLGLGTFSLTLDWGFTNGSLSVEGGDSLSSFRAGNPFLAAMYHVPGPLALELGVGVALPLATQPKATSLTELGDSLIAAYALSAAWTMRGMQELWLFSPDTLSLVVPARVSTSLGIVKLSADGALAALIATGDARNETDYGLQLGAEAMLNLGLIGVGARAAEVWILTADGDNSQLSLEPFAEVGLGPASIRAGFLINIDEPAGFSFDNNKVWGAHLSATVAL